MIAKNVKYPLMCAGIVLILSIPFFAGRGWTSLVTEMFIMAIAGTANNLMLGYAGMISFGLAAPYGLGAYTTALLLEKAGAPFGLALLAGPVVTCIIMAPIGWFCVRRKGLYFAMLTMAFAQIIYTVIIKWHSLTGGEDGIAGLPMPSILASTNYYYFALGMMAICFALMWIIINSPFGKTIRAMRENPMRSDSIGVNVRRYQLFTFVISSFFLGFAGSLFAGFNASVFPAYADWSKTFDINIVCLLGGINNFWGPSVGAILFILLSKIVTSYTDYWPLILGLVVLLITLFLRGGTLAAIQEMLSPISGKVVER